MIPGKYAMKGRLKKKTSEMKNYNPFKPLTLSARTPKPTAIEHVPAELMEPEKTPVSIESISRYPEVVFLQSAPGSEEAVRDVHKHLTPEVFAGLKDSLQNLDNLEIEYDETSVPTDGISGQLLIPSLDEAGTGTMALRVTGQGGTKDKVNEHGQLGSVSQSSRKSCRDLARKAQVPGLRSRTWNGRNTLLTAPDEMKRNSVIGRPSHRRTRNISRQGPRAEYASSMLWLIMMSGVAASAASENTVPFLESKSLATDVSQTGWISYGLSLIGPPLPPLIALGGLLHLLWAIYQSFTGQSSFREPKYIDVISVGLAIAYLVVRRTAEEDSFAMSIALASWFSLWGNYVLGLFQMVVKKRVFVWSCLILTAFGYLSIITFTTFLDAIADNNKSSYDNVVIDATPLIMTIATAILAAVMEKSKAPEKMPPSLLPRYASRDDALTCDRPDRRYAYLHSTTANMPGRQLAVADANPWQDQAML